MGGTFKNSFYAGLLVAFVLGVWLLQLWDAENQVRLHSEHLIRQMEKQNWTAVENFLAADYHDDWGDDRARLLQRFRMLGRFLVSLTIIPTEARTQVDAQAGAWSARIDLEARGEAAVEITSRVNGLTTPFQLHWRKESWKPWDWKLVQVSNPELEVPGGDLQ